MYDKYASSFNRMLNAPENKNILTILLISFIKT